MSASSEAILAMMAIKHVLLRRQTIDPPDVASCSHKYGPHPEYGWDFPEEIPEKFRKDPGNALRAFPGISLESTAGMLQTL